MKTKCSQIIAVVVERKLIHVVQIGGDGIKPTRLKSKSDPVWKGIMQHQAAGKEK